MMISSSIHFFENNLILFFFTVNWNIMIYIYIYIYISCIYHIYIIYTLYIPHTFNNWWADSITYLLWPLSNKHECASVCVVCWLWDFGNTYRSDIDELYGSFIFNFLKKLYIDFHIDYRVIYFLLCSFEGLLFHTL
jgi:hypothetical protein